MTKSIDDWRMRERCLLLMAAAMPFSFSVWMTLLNNFSFEMAAFGGTEIGILQSIREIPGLLAFTAIFILLAVREQVFALLSLSLLGVGVALTGLFPSEYGLYATTLLMSIGFHYFETIQMSLSLQWLPESETSKSLGRQLAAKSAASIAAYLMMFIGLEFFNISYAWLYAIAGTVTLFIVGYIKITIPRIDHQQPQHKKVILKRNYWLFYALTFMGGARRQIFVVFAGFLLVQKFGFPAKYIVALYAVNYIVTSFFAPFLGRWIAKFGERRALLIEYIGLILVFSGYALTNDVYVAATLYVLDHIFFSFAIAQKSYLKKIADPKDIAATSSVSFSINHIAAVIIPATFGAFLWSVDPSYVFWAGAAMAVVSLILSFNVPDHPAPGNETRFGANAALPAPAE